MRNLSRFRAVIFDFDGVIVDSEPVQAQAWMQVGTELRLPACRVSVEHIAGRIDREVADELFPGSDVAWCVSRKAQIEAELEAAGELRPVDGIRPFIRRVAATHLLAICSSCHPVIIARRLDRLGMSDSFRVVVGRVEGLRHKPAPDLYLRALDELAVSAADACAIEDSPTGIAAAKAAGVYAIQLLRSGMPRDATADEWLERL